MGVKTGVKEGTTKMLELAVAAIVGAFASVLVNNLLAANLSGWSFVKFSFLSAVALMGYCALGLSFIYGLELINRRREKKEENDVL